jgi:short-subunit dehydrogenase
MKNIIILGVNADIGRNIANLYLKNNYKVIGTYRKKKPKDILFKYKKNFKFLKCDITDNNDVRKLKFFIKKNKFKWNTIFSSVGTSKPIGKFFKINFKNWQKSVDVNFLSQIKVVHSLYPLRNKKYISNIVFLAGGGTNNPFRFYSAYCVSKIALIKICELIDDEYKDVNIFIVGPGFTKTKTHLETLKAGKNAGSNLNRVLNFLRSKNKGTSFEDIFKCINWGINKGKKIVSGRNFSVVHDKWGHSELEKKLILDKNMFKLRRYKN